MSFFRGSVSWIFLADGWGCGRRESIRVILEKKTTFVRLVATYRLIRGFVGKHCSTVIQS